MPSVVRIKIHPQTQPGSQAPLDIPSIRQEQTNWCWATCAKMAIAYYGNDLPRQCDFANWLFSLSSCCQDGSTNQCNLPANAPQISSVYTHWGVNSTYQAGELSFSVLQGQISVGQPVEIGWLWLQGGGHVVLVIGCTIQSGVEYVYINDPWSGRSLITYADLKSGKGHGRWAASWSNIVKI